MFVGDLVAVAEHLCDKGRRDLGNESPDGRGAGAEQIDAKVADAGHQCVRVEVLARSIAWKHEITGGSCCSAEIRAAGEMLPEKVIERCWNRDGLRAECQAKLVRGNDHIGGSECRDLDQWLRVEQQKNGGDSIGQ